MVTTIYPSKDINKLSKFLKIEGNCILLAHALAHTHMRERERERERERMHISLMLEKDL